MNPDQFAQLRMQWFEGAQLFGSPQSSTPTGAVLCHNDASGQDFVIRDHGNTVNPELEEQEEGMLGRKGNSDSRASFCDHDLSRVLSSVGSEGTLSDGERFYLKSLEV